MVLAICSFFLAATDPNFLTVVNELVVVGHKWLRIGISLGVPKHKLHEFEKNGDPFSEAIDYWMKGNTMKPITWGTVVSALGSPFVDEAGLARSLRHRYMSDNTPVQSGKSFISFMAVAS